MRHLTDSRHDHRQAPGFRRFIIPALLAVLIHLVFFAFKTKPAPSVHAKANVRTVMLLPQNSSAPDEKKLLSWMKIMDPTYVIKPNRNYGFSTTFQPSELKDIQLDLEDGFSENATATQTDFLPVPWQDLRSRVKRLWKYKPAGIKPIETAVLTKKHKFPIWLTENNDLLPQLFNNTENLRKTIEKHPPPIRETVLKVLFFGPNFFPDVTVAHSCGNESLDNFAARTMTVKGKYIALNDPDEKKSLYISVKWYPSIRKHIPSSSEPKLDATK